MAGKRVRAVIVGATSVLAKELAEQLNESTAAVWDLTLLDAEDAGQMTAAGDEPLIVQPVDAAAFAGADVVFFAGDAAMVREHWRAALAAGASVVDVTGALAGESGVLVMAPGVGARKPDLSTTAVVPVGTTASMLGLVLQRLSGVAKGLRVAATVMEPASTMGAAGMDEMHQQTVALLSFQGLHKEIYDSQVAFTLRDRFGEGAKASLAKNAAATKQQLRGIVAAEVRWSLELLQAPVFHGTTASLWFEFAETVPVEAVASALHGAGMAVVAADSEDEVSNVAVTGQDDLLVSLRATDEGLGGFWLWIAADNLRLAARNAIACAGELLALRPGATLQ